MREVHYTDADASGADISSAGTRTFINGDSAHECGEDQVSIFGELAVRTKRHVNDIARLENNVRGFAVKDVVEINHGDLWFGKRAANDCDVR